MTTAFTTPWARLAAGVTLGIAVVATALVPLFQAAAQIIF